MLEQTYYCHLVSVFVGVITIGICAYQVSKENDGLPALIWPNGTGWGKALAVALSLHALLAAVSGIIFIGLLFWQEGPLTFFIAFACFIVLLLAGIIFSLQIFPRMDRLANFILNLVTAVVLSAAMPTALYFTA